MNPLSPTPPPAAPFTDVPGSSSTSVRRPTDLPPRAAASSAPVLPSPVLPTLELPPAGARGHRATLRPAISRTRLTIVTMLTDALLLGAAAVLAAVARDHLPVFEEGYRVTQSLWLIAPVLVSMWLALIAAVGGYGSEVFGVGTDEYRRIVRGSTLTAAAVGITCFLLDFPLSRGFFFVVFTAGVPALLAGRLVRRQLLKSARSRGRLATRVLVCGTPDHVDEIAAVLGRETWLGYRVVGALLPHDAIGSAMAEGGRTRRGVRVLGAADDVVTAVRGHQPDVVVLADGAVGSDDQARRLVWQLEDDDVRVMLAPRLTDVSQERVRMRPMAGLPLVHLEKSRSLRASRAGKRLFDVVAASLLLVVFSPVFLVVAVAIKRHDGGSVLFKQRRVGMRGVPFDCVKFRTMVPDAEALLASLKVGDGPGLFKLDNDPRITAPGAWLRRYSLDELPQLLNVLKGDMSLVGPRPGLISEARHYAGGIERRLRVRPGMTGLWQVSGRADLTYDESVRLDLYYVDNWSMVQDLQILVRTLTAVAGGRGAY